MPEEAPVNTGAPWPVLSQARERVLGMQAKLHQWAAADGNRRFDDVYSLVCDPAFLRLAWERVATNAGARSAGVDGHTACDIEAEGTADGTAGRSPCSAQGPHVSSCVCA